MFTYHWIKKLMSLIISSINWNYKPNDLHGLFAKYDPWLCNLEDTQVRQARLAKETFSDLYPLVMKRSRSPRRNEFFTDYRDMKFKLTAHRLDPENRNTVIWNKNYRNTAPKMTQYRNTANPYAPLLVLCFPLPGKHISLVLCVPPPGKHISLVLCVPPPGKHRFLVLCVPPPGKHISVVLCVPPLKKHI